MTAKSPKLSVIIADVNGPPMIDSCLTALSKQADPSDIEVIVAEATGESTAKLISERFPWVRVLTFSERLTIPQLRAAALEQSTGDLVAVIEDHCDVDESWYAEIVKAHDAHPECVAVGGVVENGNCERLMDWAVFFSEYSPYMTPVTQGVYADIPGNNVAYKRAAFEGIDGLEDDLNKGFWESTLHPKLLARGETFLSQPSIVVYHRKRFGFFYSLSQRFHYSRYYAGTLFGSAGAGTRLYRSAVSVALPALLMARILRRVVQKKRNRRQLVLTTPIIAVIAGVWAVGELVGSLFGPGQSLSKIE